MVLLLKAATIIIDGFCSVWMKKSRYTNIRWAIQSDPEGWSLTTIDSERFPIEISEEDQKHEDFIFIHKAKFIAKFKTCDLAIKCATKL